MSKGQELLKAVIDRQIANGGEVITEVRATESTEASPSALNRATFTVTIETDGDADELAALFGEYLTLGGDGDTEASAFISDYGPGAWGGYDGPFVRTVVVERTDKIARTYSWRDNSPGIEAVLNAYIECALWASTDTGEDGTDDGNFEGEGELLTDDAIEAMRAEVVEFCRENRGLIEQASQLNDQFDEGMVGHDIWLTRNGHGAGFWDRGLGEVGERLSARARLMGESTIYRGDDGRLHVQ